MRKRKWNKLRDFKIKKNYLHGVEESVFVTCGNTKLVCVATQEEKVPPFLTGKNKGWVTAEYAMLPRSSPQRIKRERGNVGGRTQEIQRLIGRSLRSVVDTTKMPGVSIIVDCDVLSADGGTRVAAINGAFVALVLLIKKLMKLGKISEMPVKDYLAAISVGVVEEKLLLDLEYEDDSKAEVDMNIVMTGRGQFVEVQGTAENNPFDKKQLDAMLVLAKSGLEKIIKEQKAILREEFSTGHTK